MKIYEGMHTPWKPFTCVLEKPIQDTAFATGIDRKFSQKLFSLQCVIQEAMETAQMNYVLEQQLRGLYGSHS